MKNVKHTNVNDLFRFGADSVGCGNEGRGREQETRRRAVPAAAAHRPATANHNPQQNPLPRVQGMNMCPCPY